MRYVSTRGEAPSLDFEETLLAGLARDGGLYLPEAWPTLSPETFQSLQGAPYEDAAVAVMRAFAGDCFPEAELRPLVQAAYREFRHPARAPLVQIGDNEWVLELHRGPTIAFKDFAMQLIGQLFEAALSRRGRRATIVGATSGDTGSAAIEAFKGLDQVDVFILYPHGRVSEVQRRQMTTPDAPNVHALAVEGSFDDCQALVKAMFNDFEFRDRVGLAAVNSINWARVAAQIVYYVTAALSLGGPARPVSFAVPTGNFGDIFAGWSARQMGLPIEQLVIAVNENDILHRAMTTGRYDLGAVRQTTSPSMDIQISSNFERALFEASGRDAAAVRGMMDALKQSGGFEAPTSVLSALRSQYLSARADEATVAATIRDVFRESGYLLDPHTAVGVAGARQKRADRSADRATPMIALGCAHAAKFPDAVEAAAGVRPPLPSHLADLFERRERISVVDNDLGQLQSLIEDRRLA